LQPIALMRCGRHWDHMCPPGPRSVIPHDWHLCDRCIREMRHYRADNVVASDLFEHIQIMYSAIAPYIDNHSPHWAHKPDNLGLSDEPCQAYGEPSQFSTDLRRTTRTPGTPRTTALSKVRPTRNPLGKCTGHLDKITI
jgi:hypothetical protein